MTHYQKHFVLVPKKNCVYQYFSVSNQDVSLFCDLTTSLGWTLVGMVSISSAANVNEPNTWFTTGYCTNLGYLQANTMVDNT